MNIRNFWPTKKPPLNSQSTWAEILELRRKTFLGFLEIEKDRGFISQCSLHSSKGQEMVRILLFRTFEELAESVLSSDPDHWKEEMIDAINFLYGIIFLDETIFDTDSIAELLHQLAEDPNIYSKGQMTPGVVGDVLVLMGLTVGDYLRNRAWMNHAQDLYFNGIEPLRTFLLETTKKILGSFNSFQEFWQYYVAKDSVLQFRLRSKY